MNAVWPVQPGGPECSSQQPVGHIGGDVDRARRPWGLGSLVGLGGGEVDLVERHSGNGQPRSPAVVAGAEDHHLGGAGPDRPEDEVVEEQRPGSEIGEGRGPTEAARPREAERGGSDPQTR